MSTDLKEYIIDAYDEVMNSYYCADEYRDTAQEIDDQIEDFRSALSPSQDKAFLHILNSLSNQYAGVAGEAFYRGVTQGVSLRYDVK